MSGTKSPSRREPVISIEQPKALIVAHGQPSDPLPAEAALAKVTARVQACLSGTKITSATMANPGVLEQAIDQLPADAPVFPLFMADGWFVKSALAKRLEHHALRVLTPLGVNTNLPALAAQAVLQSTEASGWRARDTEILLAAHGSAQGEAAARSARQFAARLSDILPCAGITVGFLEEEPFLNGAATGLKDPALCLPFFAMEGEHVRDDIPEALNKARFSGPVLSPFGQYGSVARLIAEVLSVQIGERKAP